MVSLLASVAQELAKNIRIACLKYPYGWPLDEYVIALELDLEIAKNMFKACLKYPYSWPLDDYGIPLELRCPEDCQKYL